MVAEGAVREKCTVRLLAACRRHCSSHHNRQDQENRGAELRPGPAAPGGPAQGAPWAGGPGGPGQGRGCCQAQTGLLHTKLLRRRQQQKRGETSVAACRSRGSWPGSPAPHRRPALPQNGPNSGQSSSGRHFILGAYRRAGVARSGDERAPRPSLAPNPQRRPHAPAPHPRTAPPPLARPKAPDIRGVRRMRLPGNCALTKHGVT